MSKRLRVGITGASGYIGRVVMSRARAMGHDVVVLGRQAPPDGNAFRRCKLSERPPEGLLDGLDGVIHLAADTSGDQGLATSEVAFATAMAEQASRVGAALIVVSSQASSPAAPSAYGRTKAAIESAVLPLGATVVRPGMVYGGALTGLWGMLARAVRGLPFIPDLRPRPLVQPIHVRDLADIVLLILSRRYSSRVFNLAGSPVTFDRFMMAIAEYRFGVCRLRLRVPVPLLRTMLALAERVAGPKVSPQRLDSLTKLPLLSADGDLRELGVELRPLSDGMTRSGRSLRRVLVEGRSLMKAVLGSAPSPWATRVYARAVSELCNGRALALPAHFLHFPLLLAALDTPDFRRDSNPDGLARRLAMATRVAEAETGDSERFILPVRRAGAFFAALDFLRAAVSEVLCRLVAPYARWRSVR